MALSSPKRSDASAARLGGADKSAHQYQRPGPPTPTHRVTQTVAGTPAPGHYGMEAIAVWHDATSQAEWLAPSDLASLRLLCDMIDRRDGLVAGHASSRDVVQLDTLILKTMAQLGLTPASRIQLGLATVEAETKLELFLAGGTHADTGTDD